MRLHSISPYHLVVGYNKTSNIIFPYSILSVDRGSDAVIVQKANGLDNILQVKAGVQNFQQTNLTVITSDGVFYSFLIDCASEPFPLNISFNSDTSTKTQSARFTGSQQNEADLDQMAQILKNLPAFMRVTSRNQKMQLTLSGIFLQDDLMWFSLGLANNSLIPFTPGNIKFYVRDKKTAKRTAVQELNLQSVYHNTPIQVNGNQTKNLVIAFPAFTIPRTKELHIQIGEGNGGRQLMMKLNHKHILRTKYLEPSGIKNK